VLSSCLVAKLAGLQENIPLAPLTTLKIGGPARYFLEAKTEKEVLEAVSFAEDKNIPLFILGGGSNLLIADEGFNGLVLRVAITGVKSSRDGNNVILNVGAGEDWDNFVNQCVEQDLAGIECLSGIPGLVGGTPIQNVGAYGQEVERVIVSVRAYSRAEHKVVELSRDDCGFAYRTSIFNTTARDRYIVLSVCYRLRVGGEPTIQYADLQRYFAGQTDRVTLKAVREAVRRIRLSKAMLLVPGDVDCQSAGSFFKNPIVSPETFARIESIAGQAPPRYPAPNGRIKTSAAWLIEQSGFVKGAHRGRVGISSKHTLAIINRGGATAKDVIAFMREIQTGVQQRFGIELIPEPVFVGFDR